MFEPLSALADIHYGKSPIGLISGEGSIPVFGTGGVYAKATRSLFNGPAVIVPRKGTLSSPHYVRGPFWASDTTYAALPKQTVDANWLHYQLSQFRLELLNEATGVPSISRDWLEKIKIYHHAPNEQLTVARILGSIDSQIEATEAQIAKQERVRAGLLQVLFTRGVDEHGDLRPSREEAPQSYHETKIGWLPKGWDVAQMKDYAGAQPNSFVNGPFGSDLLASELRSEGIRVIYIRDIDGMRYRRVSTVCVEHRKAAQLAFCSVRTGDVLIAKVGDPPCMAALYLDPEDAIVTQDVIRIRPSVYADGIFISSFVNSQTVKSLIQKIVVAGTRSRVSLTDLKSLLVPRPSLLERKGISEIVSVLDRTAESLKQQISVYIDFKTALMQDLLTGRVSVAPLLESVPT
jgi:type I restriction enzyme S subunit